jgi:peptidoglycan-associated lipoprotein
MPPELRAIRTRLIFGSLFFALPFLAGCPPEYPHCKEDSNCASHGGVCLGGICKECRDDSQCKPGYECQEGACLRKKVPPGTCNEDTDCPGGQTCQGRRCVTPVMDAGPEEEPDAGTALPPHMAPAACDLQEIHFDFNEFALNEPSRTALERDADCIKQTKRSVTIEGHTDERGTDEYNLVLGEKRADAVRRFLVQLGVNESSLKTVSYGKEHPKDPGHTDVAWAANRRAELIWR